MLAAVKENAEAFRHADETLRKDEKFMQSAVVTNYRALKYIKDDFLFLLELGIGSPKFCLNCFRYFWPELSHLQYDSSTISHFARISYYLPYP